MSHGVKSNNLFHIPYVVLIFFYLAEQCFTHFRDGHIYVRNLFVLRVYGQRHSGHVNHGLDLSRSSVRQRVPQPLPRSDPEYNEVYDHMQNRQDANRNTDSIYTDIMETDETSRGSLVHGQVQQTIYNTESQNPGTDGEPETGAVPVRDYEQETRNETSRGTIVLGQVHQTVYGSSADDGNN